MSISEILFPEFDQEMANTRKVLERVPAGKADWKPHEKSMTLGRLAGHIAELPGWGAMIFNLDVLDLTPMVTGDYKAYVANSPDELLQTFDKNVSDARAGLVAASDAHLNQIWSIQLKGKTMLSGPRLPMVRNMFLNHLIHHRGQLGVYLRLNGIPLPPLYGPTADEGKSFIEEVQ
jgi:uncharacterized damage-inducible protein DinB